MPSRRTEVGGGRSGRLFLLLLALFPRAFRDAFGEEMRAVFEAQRRDARTRGRSATARFWLRTCAGMISAAWRERRVTATAGGNRLPWHETLIADIRFAVRMLARTPMFATIVVVTIAIGVGGVATIFSALNAVVLRPLPGTTDGGRLVDVERRARDASGGVSASHAFYTYLAAASRSLDGVAAWSRVALSIERGGRGHAVSGNIVSGNYFTVLGVRPAAGRFFLPDEDAVPLAQPVVVVSYAFWVTELDRDPSAVGAPIMVNGRSYRLIGVAPERFRGVFTPLKIDAWVPLAMQPHVHPGRDLQDMPWLRVFGRLAPGIAPAQARAELSALTTQWAASHDDGGFRTFTNIRLTPLTGLPDDARRALLGFGAVLLAAAVLVLVIAGANVSSLLAARAVSRRREIGVRVALGATRGRLVRQLLTETLTLFLLGAVGGTLLAAAATAALEHVPVPSNAGLSLELSPDGRVLALAIILSLLAGIVFGVGPALRGTSRNPSTLLRATSAGAGRRTHLASALIVAQVACSLVLLTAAGLFVRALAAGAAVDPRFDSAGVSVTAFNTEAYGYDEARGRAFYETLRQRLERLPEIERASASTVVPLTFSDSGTAASIARTLKLPIRQAVVDAGYFDTIRIPLLSGRDFTPGDATGPSAAIVNETFATRAWGAGDPVGRTFVMGGTGQMTVVGLVRNSRYASLDEGEVAYVYLPLARHWENSRTVFVRGRAGIPPSAALLAREVAAIDPGLPTPVVSTLEHETSVALVPQRVAAMVTGTLGALGLLLAAVGLYALVGFSVTLRMREIGVRLALGARAPAVVRLVVAGGLRLIALGVAVGLAASLLTSRLLRAYLLTVSPLDPTAFAGAAVMLTLVTLVAAYVPARRAASADPLVVLQSE